MIHNVSARGIVQRNGKILFIEYVNQGIVYSLPGGSQNVAEDLRSTLIREFKEETNLDIETHEVVIVREFIIHSSQFEPWKKGIHQVEIIFRCTLCDPEQIATPGVLQDHGMTGLRWIGQDEIKSLRVYPSNNLFEIMENEQITYLIDRE